MSTTPNASGSAHPQSKGGSVLKKKTRVASGWLVAATVKKGLGNDNEEDMKQGGYGF